MFEGINSGNAYLLEPCLFRAFVLGSFLRLPIECFGSELIHVSATLPSAARIRYLQLEEGF